VAEGDAGAGSSAATLTVSLAAMMQVVARMMAVATAIWMERRWRRLDGRSAGLVVVG
jgi:mannose/fructose/N-acetylgalactosamine-specific phosphotransferase system component IIC